MKLFDQRLLTVPLAAWHRTGTVWSFFGSTGASPMTGKPEHVDQLRPGVITMHSQICGRKVWMLRPNPLANWEKVPMSSERIEICCEEGDQLLIDTTAWYHATQIPAGTSFTWSIAQDCSKEMEVSSSIVSVQLRISQQLCQLCLTPTTPPLGSPPGTCGCWCCGQERSKVKLWSSFKLSSLLSQRFLWEQLRIRSFSVERRLAICDRKIVGQGRTITLCCNGLQEKHQVRIFDIYTIHVLL